MLFNSFIFWIFFGIVAGLYLVLPHRYQNRMLLTASYIFYGYWDYRFLSLILLSTIVDYYVALGIARQTEQKTRKELLSVSIVVNLGLLGFFKYYGFFAGELARLFELLSLPVSLPLLTIVLPVGISFYTFQTMSYTIDVYRGKTTPTRNFLDFALYVSFFPQLVAGPIERSYRLLPQIVGKRVYDREALAEGTYHVVTGLFKKVVIADNMAPIVNSVFSRPVAELTGPEIAVGVYAFAFQIYGDFSGYSSIAQGIARWLGFRLSWNFKMPYFAGNPSEFWQRWHITLSTWLRDYLYVTLGGNRRGRLLTLRNLLVTMFLGGLWHGAQWTFILWGLYHGLLLALYRIAEMLPAWPGRSWFRTQLGRWVGKIVFFHLVCISWLLFRAESAGQAGAMLVTVLSDFRFTDFTFYAAGLMLFFVGPLLAFEYWIERSGDLLVVINTHWLVQTLLYGYFVGMIVIFPPLTNQVFIYFQF